MATDSVKHLFIGLLLFGLCSVLIITVILNLGVIYSVSPLKMNETTGGAFDITDLESNLSESDSNTENLRKRFSGGDVEDVDDASGVFSIIGDTFNLIILPLKMVGEIAENKLHIPSIVTAVIMAIIGIIAILGIWRILRTGD